MQFTDEQKKRIDQIVEERLNRERKIHRREMTAQEHTFRKEIEVLRLELRSERALVMRIRESLGR